MIVQDIQTIRPAWVEKLDRRPGVILAFLWGLAEGTFFFVVPDVAISLAALFNPRRTWRHVTAAIFGALLAGATLYTWSSYNPASAHRTIARVPFVTTRMLTKVHTSYETHGLTAVILGPLSGIPYKIYAIEAPPFATRAAFLWCTIPARGERFLLVWLIFGIIGTLLRKLHWQPKQLAIFHGSFWLLFYTFYWAFIFLRSRT